MHFWTVPFTALDREYEVRVVFDGLTFRMRVFRENRPANQFEYSVTMETATDMQDITGVNAVQELIRTAQEHVRRGF